MRKDAPSINKMPLFWKRTEAKNAPFRICPIINAPFLVFLIVIVPLSLSFLVLYMILIVMNDQCKACLLKNNYRDYENFKILSSDLSTNLKICFILSYC